MSEENLIIRPCVERLAWTAARLRTGTHLNATTIARHFEVSTKTAFRDLEFLRDRLCYDFAFDYERNTYVLRGAPEPVL